MWFLLCDCGGLCCVVVIWATSLDEVVIEGEDDV